MPDHRQMPIDPADAPLDPTLARAAAALRAPVPVRPEWRARVIDAAARSAHSVREPRRRLLVLSWPAAAAAAVALLATGAVFSRTYPRLPAASPAASPATNALTAATAPGTRFVFVAPNAKHVALVGDFNLWDPSRAPMHRISGTDAWEVDLPLEPGRHAYAFVVDGDVTADPSAPRTAGDDFGRPSSVVLVSSNRS
jgi:hypothetical protein